MDVFIVESSGVVRQSLQCLLAEIPDIEIVGYAANEPDAIKRINALLPDVVILDCHLQSGAGIDVLENIKKHHATIKTIVFTHCTDKIYVDRCKRAGADYFIDKSLQFMQLREILSKLARPDSLDNKFRSGTPLKDTSSKNISTQQPINHPENDRKNCRGRMRVINDANLVECLTDVIICHWALPFEDTRFCNHPSAKQFVI